MLGDRDQLPVSEPGRSIDKSQHSQRPIIGVDSLSPIEEPLRDRMCIAPTAGLFARTSESWTLAGHRCRGRCPLPQDQSAQTNGQQPQRGTPIGEVRALHPSRPAHRCVNDQRNRQRQTQRGVDDQQSRVAVKRNLHAAPANDRPECPLARTPTKSSTRMIEPTVSEATPRRRNDRKMMRYFQITRPTSENPRSRAARRSTIHRDDRC